jgi:aminoglycoside 6'-N-acetyltransferase I
LLKRSTRRRSYNERMKLTIRPAAMSDLDQLAGLRFLLWPDSPVGEHRLELTVEASTSLPVAAFVASDEAGAWGGFVEVALRSHADGCDPARPVGFVEGWFVCEGLRRQGVGKNLLAAAEQWARAQGCREMASDALIEAEMSIAAHQALGFEVVDRCVHFRKDL